jgi:hypothetical protein
MLKELIEIYLKKAYNLKWYYVRLEYQNRGTIHAHILFKSNDEPSVDQHKGLIELGKLIKAGYFANKELNNKKKSLNQKE